MPRYSSAELNELPKFEDPDEALRNPEKVIRFEGYRIEDAARLARISDFRNLPHTTPISLCDDRLKETYSGCDSLRPSVDHHLNGYTFTQHESPQEQAADEFRGKSDEWVPLLQLGWDDHVGFCFWDAGTLTFSIHQEALRRHDFSKVHVALESS